MPSTTVDQSGKPIPTSSVLMAASKHIAVKCRAENMAFIKCKKKDPNPEKCLDKGREVTHCVLSLNAAAGSTPRPAFLHATLHGCPSSALMKKSRVAEPRDRRKRSREQTKDMDQMLQERNRRVQEARRQRARPLESSKRRSSKVVASEPVRRKRMRVEASSDDEDNFIVKGRTAVKRGRKDSKKVSKRTVK